MEERAFNGMNILRSISVYNSEAEYKSFCIETFEISNKKFDGDYPDQRSYCQIVVKDGKMFIYGGLTESYKEFFDFWLLHLGNFFFEKNFMK